MIAGPRQVATVAVSCLAQLMVAVDITVLHLAVPALTVQLGASAEAVLWVADIYGFATSGLLVTMGGLGDRFGRRRVLLWGIGAFGVASVLAAYAPSVALLIVARALLGVAAAAILPSAGSLLRAVFVRQRSRAAAVGISSGVSAAGFALGPIVGGILLDHFWWGSVFLVNVPVMLVLGIAATWVPESRTPGRLRIDAPSVVLSVVGLIGLVYALKGAFYAGPLSPDVLAAFAAGTLGLGVFVRRQHVLDEPLIDLRLFRNRAFTASVASNLVAVSTMSAFALITSQYFQLVRGWSPLRSGLAFVPGAVVAMATGVAAGLLAARIGRARAVALGLGLAAGGFVVVGEIEPHSPYTTILVAQVLFGAGSALTLTVTGDTILGSAPVRRAGAASGISSTAYELGGALGIAVIGTVVSAVYRFELVLPPDVPRQISQEVAESFGATAALARGLPEPVRTAVVEAAHEAFTGGIRLAMLASAVLMAVLALTALISLRGVPRRIEQTPEHGPGPGATGPGAPGHGAAGPGATGPGAAADGSPGRVTNRDTVRVPRHATDRATTTGVTTDVAADVTPHRSPGDRAPGDEADGADHPEDDRRGGRTPTASVPGRGERA